jgi:hypothetical protein
LVNRLPYPYEECFDIEWSTGLQRLVQYRECQCCRAVDIFIEDEWEYGHLCVDCGITKNQETIKYWNGNEEENHHEDGLYERDDHASMNDELWKLCSSLIRQAPVPKNEILQMTELENREIRCQSCLHTFLANNTKSNIGLLYHRHIISAIANTRNSLLVDILDRFGHKCLLRGTASANADWFGTLSGLEKLFGDELIFHDFCKCDTIYHKHSRILVHFIVFWDQLLKIAIADETLALYLMHRLGLSIHARCNGNTFGCLDFITGEHPNLNACGSELFNGFEYVIL